jgi:RNA polymerase sigma factor (sigma-70 family)
MALAKAIKSYDPERGVPFEGFAWKCMENRCLDFLRKPSQPKSHDDMVGGSDEEDNPTTFLEAVENRVARRDFQTRGDEDDYDSRIEKVRYLIANGGLDGTEKRVVALRLRGFTVDKIATRLRMPKTSAHRLVQDAEARLRKTKK